MSQMSEVSRTIRLILGISDEYNHGFSLVFESDDGSAGHLVVWFGLDLFQLVRFADEESHIVWNVSTHEKLVGVFLFGTSRIVNEEKWEIKEIVINRNHARVEPCMEKLSV